MLPKRMLVGTCCIMWNGRQQPQDGRSCCKLRPRHRRSVSSRSEKVSPMNKRLSVWTLQQAQSRMLQHNALPRALLASGFNPTRAWFRMPPRPKMAPPKMYLSRDRRLSEEQTLRYGGPQQGARLLQAVVSRPRPARARRRRRTC
ncbi:unnamed protein product [Amoebophrya sp. A120]|nr:unnamed protein product [Amoebophrya sp. A120]|eukprot:GSA120T00024383001.1